MQIMPSKPSETESESSDTDSEASEDNNSENGDGVVPKECMDSHYLLYKNTESFRCLAQVLLSSSSLMKNRLYLFPPLDNPGIEDVFDYIEPDPSYDDIAVEKYVNLCKDLKIVPISRIKKSLGTTELNLKFYGITPKQTRALTETLKGNAHVENLNLQDNYLNQDMVTMLSSMLEENGTLRVLNLKECRIGEEGAEKLSEALSSSQFLTELDLSFNSLGDKGLLLLQRGLCETPSLKKLNISHNELTEDSAAILEKILCENRTLVNLDLSWNGFFTPPGNKKLFNGFKQNDRIKVLNLAWNGISVKPAITPIARYVRRSQALEDLDLSNNRLAGPSLKAAKAAITKNQSLMVVKIGNNPYPPEEAMLLLNMMASKGRDYLIELDMENMYVKKEAVPIIKKIRNMGKIINIGGVLSNYTIKGPDINKLLFERCRYLLMKPKKKKLQKDFGHLILSLPQKPIPRAEFDNIIKKRKMKKLDKDLITELTNKFAVKKNVLNCPEMRKVYMEYYPDTCLPPEKPKKGKKGKGKKGKTAITEIETEIKVHDLQEGEEKQPESEIPIEKYESSPDNHSIEHGEEKNVQSKDTEGNDADNQNEAEVPHKSIQDPAEGGATSSENETKESEQPPKSTENETIPEEEPKLVVEND